LQHELRQRLRASPKIYVSGSGVSNSRKINAQIASAVLHNPFD
jgi:hypothetical protein